jgi:hypothetical protein
MAVKVSASSLDDVWLQGGANLGTDTIEIEAQDNMGAWSNLDTFELVTRLPNRAPVVTPGEATAGVVQGQTVGAMSLFTVTDADGDVPAWYEFWDSGPGGGFFRIGGSPQPSGAPLQISSAVSNPADVLYQGGAVPGSETVWLRVNDGTVWSPWVSRQVVTQRANNAAPVVDAPPTRNIEESQWQRLSFINVTDPEGDPIVAFRLKDTNGSEGSARLWANGSYLDSGVAVEVGASDLSGLWVQGGTANGTDTIEIEAQDNMGAWSNLDAFDLVTRFPNRAPVVTVTAATQSVSANQAVDAASLFSSSDPDMDAMTQYEFLDVGVGGGRFLVNGTAMGEGDGKNFTVTAAQLMQTTYTGGLSAGTETLWVRASDGTAWSAWKSWQMATLAA